MRSDRLPVKYIVKSFAHVSTCMRVKCLSCRVSVERGVGCDAILGYSCLSGGCVGSGGKEARIRMRDRPTVMKVTQVADNGHWERCRDAVEVTRLEQHK